MNPAHVFRMVRMTQERPVLFHPQGLVSQAGPRLLAAAPVEKCRTSNKAIDEMTHLPARKPQGLLYSLKRFLFFPFWATPKLQGLQAFHLPNHQLMDI